MHDRSDIDPRVVRGKPVIRGTRIPVDLVLRKLGAGMTTEEIIADHPRLTVDDIRAAHAFAAEVMTCNMMTEDAQAGIDAFVAKRPMPEWQGR